MFCLTDRVSILLENILSVWSCHCDRQIGRNSKPLFCPCLVSNPAKKSFSIPEIDPSLQGPSFVVKVFHAVKNDGGLQLEMLSMSAHDSNNKAGIDARAASEHILVGMAYKIRDTVKGN